jgi:HEAT repeat protein
MKSVSRLITTAALASGVAWLTGCAPQPPAPQIRGRPAEDWIRQLDEDNEFHRCEAARALGQSGADAAPAVPALIRTLKSRKHLTRPYAGGIFTFGDQAPGEAREALVSIGPPAVPALRAALRHEDARTRVNAAWALWRLEKQPGTVIPVLVEAWRDNALFVRDECIRHDASGALGEIGRTLPEQVLPTLTKTLEDEDVEIACAAIHSLSVMGTQVEQAVRLLVKALTDRREGVSNVAGWRLREVGPAAVPQLVDALTDGDPVLRWRAAWTLGGMQPEQARGAVTALRKATDDPDEEVRKWAGRALERIDGKAP